MLYPTLTYRRAYDRLRAFRGERADIEYVRILHLSASTMESLVESALAELLERGEAFDYLAVKSLASPDTPPHPVVQIPAPDLRVYDQLLCQAGAL